MIKLIRRESEPGVPLPFLPRSVGTNNYAQAGPQEDIAGIDAVEICTVASGECEIEQRGSMVTLTAGMVTLNTGFSTADAEAISCWSRS